VRPRAVLDTSALLGPQRHELVFLAHQRAYTMVWSSFLIAELARIRTEWAIRQGLEREGYRERINGLIQELSKLATLVDYTRLEGGNYTTWLNDPDDEPLLATALVGRAEYVVSHNTRDFPPDGSFAGVHYLTPLAFLDVLYQEHPLSGASAYTETWRAGILSAAIVLRHVAYPWTGDRASAGGRRGHVIAGRRRD
jgi:predicted nucleic acid-binding protein